MAETAQDGTGKWIAGGVAGIVALIGLLVASRSHSHSLYIVGLIVGALAVAFIFWMIGRSYDRADAEYVRRHDGAARH